MTKEHQDAMDEEARIVALENAQRMKTREINVLVKENRELRSTKKIELGRLLHAIPKDVIKKISLHDIHRICQNYNAVEETDSPKSTVFSRPECVWNYCPDPEECKEKCIHPGGGGGSENLPAAEEKYNGRLEQRGGATESL